MYRFRPQFSLLSTLLLMTIAAMAIIIVLQWREVLPLRQEVRRWRAEAGYLTVDDPNEAYVMQLPTFEENAWKWRIYLPPPHANKSHGLHSRSGALPSKFNKPDKVWFNEVLQKTSGASSYSDTLNGEFTLEARLLEQDGQWLLVTKYTNKTGDGTTGGHKTSIHQPSGNWLSDPRRPTMGGGEISLEQTVFEPGEPILLIGLLKPRITELPGNGLTIDMPFLGSDLETDGIVLWIEQNPSS